MKFSTTPISGLILIEPKLHGDHRGFFVETYHQAKFADAGIHAAFVQANHARSSRGTLRGLHFQRTPHAQGKLVRVTSGEIYDVAVDLRIDSPTFGHWFGVTLSEQNALELYIPPGFAHGYCVTSETADFQYFCTALYAPESEGGVAWNDPALSISWPCKAPILSARDKLWPRLAEQYPGRFPQ